MPTNSATPAASCAAAIAAIVAELPAQAAEAGAARDGGGRQQDGDPAERQQDLGGHDRAWPP